MPPSFPQPAYTCEDLGPRAGEAALVPAGRAMLAGLERIADPAARSEALREALVDNPVSAQPLWAAVEAWGGVRRPEGGPVLVTDLAAAEGLLARDAAASTPGGPAALLCAITSRPSCFLRAPDPFLASRQGQGVLGAAERSAVAYLEIRSGGRDVHLPMLIDAVLAGVLGEWLGVGEQARATRLLGLANHAAAATLAPWPEPVPPHAHLAAALLAALGDGPVTRLESYWLGALATHDRLAARAAAVDTLLTLAGPVAMASASALRRALWRGRLAGGAAQASSAQSGTRTALPSFDATPAPPLLALSAQGGVHPAIDPGDRVLVSLCHVLRNAGDARRSAALPWLDGGALTPLCTALFDGVVRALTRCERLESRGPNGFRFAALMRPSAPEPARRWRFGWWR